MSRLSLFLAAASVAALGAWSAPAVASAPLATDRCAPRALLDFWRSHGPGTTLGESASESAPGWFRDAPPLHVHQPSNDARIPAAEADLMKRRLEVAFRALMAQPSLKDIHGASLAADINVSVVPTESGARLVSASLGFIARPITLDDPATYALDGRYQTPGEGAVLRVTLNPYEFVSSRDLVADAVAGRVLCLRAGSGGTLLVDDDGVQPGVWDVREEASRLETDRSWSGQAGGLHPLMVYWSSDRQANQAMNSGRLSPTNPISRLAAAVFMVDWDAVQREMASLE